MPRSSRSLFLIVSFALMIVISGALPSFAAISATADVSTPQTSAPFTYTVTVHNNGTTNIDTVWFAWTDVPADYDFLPTSPTNITAPTNWITPTFVTHSGFPGDGYGIEWYTVGSNPITPGSSSSAFTFTSNDTPAHLAGNAFFSRLQGDQHRGLRFASGKRQQIFVCRQRAGTGVGFVDRAGCRRGTASTSFALNGFLQWMSLARKCVSAGPRPHFHPTRGCHERVIFNRIV